MSAQTLAVLLVLGVGGGILFVQVRDVMQRQSGSGVVLLTGLALVFLGEYWFGEGSVRLLVSGIGLAAVLGSVGLRYQSLQHSEGARRDGHQQALIWTGVSAGSLLLYGLTLDGVTDSLAFDEESRDRWIGVWWSLFPIATLIGLLATLLIDRMLAQHPIVMPAGALRNAQLSGVSAALAVSLMFPLNYLAHEADVDWDVAYFRTTRAGESTLNLVRTLTDPVEVIAFYAAGSDVARELEPYFSELAAASEGRLSMKVVDQAMDPTLAEELKVRGNGTIVLRSGEATESFRLNKNIDRAKRELRKLDSTVQEHLVKLTRGERTVYFLTGHGEANWRESDDQFRKLALYKRELLESVMGLKVKTLGVTDGSASAVPDDAKVVVVAGPTEPLLAEETETLKRYYDNGGSLLVMVDPGGDPLTDLLGHIGVEPGAAVLANAAAHARLTGGPADYVYLATNKYGSHSSVKQLSRNSAVAHMVFPTALPLAKKEDAEGRVTTLIRTVDDTWEDLDGNYEHGRDERKQVFDLAVAVVKELEPEGGEATEEESPAEARAIVVGDVGYLSDMVVQRMRANALFALDSFKWLAYDEEITGKVESEEDVKIVHTREDDHLWFLSAVVVVPGLVLLAGIVMVRMRQRRN